MGKKFYISFFIMWLLIMAAVMKELLFESVNPLLFLTFYSIPSNMAISVFPHEPLVVYYGRLYDPSLIAAIVMIGTIIAGILDYYVFAPIMEHRVTKFIRNTAEYKKAQKWFNYQPFLAIVIGGFSPLPFFIFKLLAFAAKYSVIKYLIALFVGRFPRYYLLAYAGSFFEIPPEIILIIFIVMISFYAISMWIRFRKAKTEKETEAVPLNEEVMNESSAGKSL